MNVRVRRDDGWTIISFPDDIERVSVGLAPGDDGVTLTLTGVRDDAPNQVETGILDVYPDDEAKLNNPVPRRDGVAVPLVERQ